MIDNDTPSERFPHETHEIALALSKAQGVIKAPIKNRKVDYLPKQGPRVKYNYADLASCIEAIRKPFMENGLAIAQAIVPDGRGGHELQTMLMHASGQKIMSTYPLPNPASMRAQEFGSALTYGRRYSLCSLVGIESEDDDDGASASDNGPAVVGRSADFSGRESESPEPREFREARERRERNQADAERLLSNQQLDSLKSPQNGTIGAAKLANAVFNHAPGGVQNDAFDPGDYVCGFGRDKGKSLRDLGVKSVQHTLKWIDQVKTENNGKPVAKSLRDFEEYAKIFLLSNEERTDSQFLTDAAAKNPDPEIPF